MPTITTIGVYGFDEDEFFAALKEANVDLLCDIRWRRGVRGKKYAFANYKRLVARLEEIGIAYLYRRDLAPTPEIRQKQKDADQAKRVAKRKRDELSPVFIAAYEDEVLAKFNSQSFFDELPEGKETIALLCVEREPAACHRSLVAQKLAKDTGAEVEHLLPK